MKRERACAGFPSPKAPHECPPGPLNVTLVPIGSDGFVENAVRAPAVDRDEVIDLGPALAEEMLHAAEVAEPFLADRGDEQDIAASLDSGVQHRAHHGEHEREPPGIVPDSRRDETISFALHGHVGALGENGVEMGNQSHGLTARGSPETGQHVSDAVDLDVGHASLPEHLRVASPALFLFEGWCRDLGKLDEVLLRPRLELHDVLERLLNQRT